MSGLKVLCIAPYPVEGASARLRVLQYFPHFRARGWQVDYRPFMDSAFFRGFYQPGRRLRKVLRLLGMAWRRLGDARLAKDYDVVFLHREAAFFGPPIVEKLIARSGVPLVFDFDDAIHVPYISPTFGKLASLVKCPQKTPATIALSRAIVAGNRHLEDYARALNPNVVLVPTVVDTEVVCPAEKKTGEPLVLGWMGTHSTFPYLETLFPVLQNLAKRHDFILRVIGAGRDAQLDGVQVDNRRWNLESETRDLQGFGIGLYPIPENQWSLGKSGFKAVQYAAVGIPAVCSPVGATCDIVTDGVHGFLPRTNDEWETRLSQLISDASLRRQLGEAGRARAQEWYCLEKQAPRLSQVLLDTAQHTTESAQ
jgi:glycosyltransferase involved in cell wall biosynthesis